MLSKQSESTLHDYPIYEVCALAESLGYRMEERHLGGEQGPDIMIRNLVSRISIQRCASSTHQATRLKNRLFQLRPVAIR